jgi:hypothetical protein
MGCVRDGLLALFVAKESKEHTRPVQNRWRSRNSICMRQEPQERDCQLHPLGTWIAAIYTFSINFTNLCNSLLRLHALRYCSSRLFDKYPSHR